jgi:DNA-binding winged helix-turn-helix (wHTH) protein/tetratricopeptide (TPR) repeat protein
VSDRDPTSGAAGAPSLIEFGDFRLDSARRVLWRHGDVVALTPKALEVLVALLERAGQVMGKAELMDRVWPDTFVEEANLTVNVSAVRKALGDQPGGQPYIQTLPRRGYRFAAETRGAPRPSVPTLAVLPLQPLDPASREDHLGLGMADAVITRLSRTGQVLVRPTSTVLRYGEGAHDSQEAGQRLSVELVLDGRVQRTADRVRVTAQLVRVADGVSTWAETFDEPFTDLFRVQDRLAERVAEALSVTLGAKAARVTTRAPTDPEAYRAYLAGRFFWNKLTVPWLEKARSAFEEAVTRDPRYAAAWSGLADAYALLALYGLRRSHEAWGEAGRAARRAVELDPALPEAHLSLGFVRLFQDWDWSGAQHELLRALDLAPASAETHQWFALFLAISGRFPEALEEIQRAQQLDPLSLTVDTNAGLQLYLRQQYAPEVETHLRALELDPGYAIGHWALGLAYEQKGLFDQAIAAHRQAVALAEDALIMKTALAHAYAVAGRHEEAEQVLAELARPDHGVEVSPYRLAAIHAALGHREQALDYLERGCDARDQWMVFSKVDPQLESLRDEPRFQELLRRIGPAD